MADHMGNFSAQPEPGAAFVRVACEIAAALGLDRDRACQGEPLDYGGLTFALRQHGALDPSGLVVEIETERLLEGMEAIQCKGLLRQHLRMPPAYAGYYALSASQDVVLFCLRIDLEHDAQPAALVESLLNRALQERQQIARVFTHELLEPDTGRPMQSEPEASVA